MYVSLIFLGACVCVIMAQTFDRSYQTVSSIVGHSIPQNTKRVHFQGNQITHVPSGYFQNLPNLVLIYFYDNDISNFDDSAFSGVPNVTEISFEYNDLSLIRKGMFSGAIHLMILDLAHNNIHTIQSGSFRENTALIRMKLNDNSLPTVNEAMFDLDNRPCGLNDFKMFNNPVSCDEHLCWLRLADGDWISVVDNPVCNGPAGLSGRTWNSLTILDLNCDTSSECNGG